MGAHHRQKAPQGKAPIDRSIREDALFRKYVVLIIFHLHIVSLKYSPILAFVAPTLHKAVLIA